MTVRAQPLEPARARPRLFHMLEMLFQPERPYRGLLWRISHALRLAGSTGIDAFATDDPNVARARVSEPCAIADMFFSREGRLVDKWAHYLPIYEKLFARLRGTDAAFLEIGVFKGGSLDLWRRYLGPKATIFGIDTWPIAPASSIRPTK